MFIFWSFSVKTILLKSLLFWQELLNNVAVRYLNNETLFKSTSIKYIAFYLSVAFGPAFLRNAV